jgi:hypothetical protein
MDELLFRRQSVVFSPRLRENREYSHLILIFIEPFKSIQQLLSSHGGLQLLEEGSFVP